ncbi:MAG: hypothetical protein P8R37_02405 [Opitutae bacterium]|nr:hypothetical protein [Opitutae bacterium]
MPAILIIVLIFAGALMPEGTSEFTAELDSMNMKFAFVKQEDGTWLSYHNDKESGQTSGQFKINGLEFGMGPPGKVIPTISSADIFGVKSIEELEKLSTLKVANKEFAILKKENGFSILEGENKAASVYW